MTESHTTDRVTATVAYEDATWEYLEALDAWWALPAHGQEWDTKEEAAFCRFEAARSNLIGFASRD